MPGGKKRVRFIYFNLGSYYQGKKVAIIYKLYSPIQVYFYCHFHASLVLGLNRSENYIQMYLFPWDLREILATSEPPHNLWKASCKSRMEGSLGKCCAIGKYRFLIPSEIWTLLFFILHMKVSACK